jgi:hypothetical protein
MTMVRSEIQRNLFATDCHGDLPPGADRWIILAVDLLQLIDGMLMQRIEKQTAFQKLATHTALPVEGNLFFSSRGFNLKNKDCFVCILKSCRFRRNHGHNVGGRPVTADELRHGAHVGVDVMQEHFVAFAQPVQSRFSGRCGDEAVLRAFAVADEHDIALAAPFRQLVELVVSEFFLFF